MEKARSAWPAPLFLPLLEPKSARGPAGEPRLSSPAARVKVAQESPPLEPAHPVLALSPFNAQPPHTHVPASGPWNAVYHDIHLCAYDNDYGPLLETLKE